MADEEKKNDFGKLFKTFILYTILFIVYFCWGSTILYGCKMAAAGILPTDDNAPPFVDNMSGDIPAKPPVGIYQTDSGGINMPNADGKDAFYKFGLNFRPPTVHNKLNCESNVFTEELDKTGNPVRTTDWSMFNWNKYTVGRIFNETFAMNMNLLNKLLKFQHDFMWEEVIVFLGPLFTILLSPFITICTSLYLAYSTIINVKRWATTKGDGKPLELLRDHVWYLGWNYLWLLIAAIVVISVIFPVSFTGYLTCSNLIMFLCWAFIAMYPNNVPDKKPGMACPVKTEMHGSIKESMLHFETWNLFIINVIFVVCALTALTPGVGGGIAAAFAFVCVCSYMGWVDPFGKKASTASTV
jgi:hypothetical protein